MMLTELPHSHLSTLELPGLPASLWTDLANCMPGVRVAVVGGAVRDLLMHLQHRDPWRGLMDLDVVIEAPPQQLLKALRRSPVFLVRAARLHGRYGTVELELDYGDLDLLMDVASARREVYPQPAGKPVISADHLEADLARRDFTINAMAMLLTLDGEMPGLLDPHGGRVDLERRELRLLHSHSLRDDPTRLIRAARYAARLGFRLASSSLEQVRQTLRQWPWAWRHGDDPAAAPISLGTRMRMELELLLEREPWPLALSELRAWGGFVLLDPALQEDLHWRRRLRWAGRLGLPLLPALLTGAQDPLAVARRLQLPHGQQCLLDRWQRLRQRLAIADAPAGNGANSDDRWGWAPSRWCALLEEPGLSPEAVALALACGDGPRRPLLRWLLRWRQVRAPISAEALIAQGVPRGPELGRRLRQHRAALLDAEPGRPAGPA